MVLGLKTVTNKFIAAGDVAVISAPDTCWTILGSCVTLILHSKKLKKAVVCHAQLPEKRDSANKCSDYCTNPCFTKDGNYSEYRFASCALNYMFFKLIELGIKKNEIDIYLIGGASILNLSISGETVGDQNVNIMKKMLKRLNANIYYENVGGNNGRKIIFNPESGDLVLTFTGKN